MTVASDGEHGVRRPEHSAIPSPQASAIGQRSPSKSSQNEAQQSQRWGPGWWIDHPGQGQSADRAAIAAQLREIRAADPS
jgi:hypothetical protein